MAELVALASGYDLVLLDLGAGLERTVRQMAGLARTKLIVATDEPTSLTDAYAFIKLAHMQDPQVGTGGPDLRIVINMAASPAEGARTYATLLKACESFLKISPRLAGVIRRDSQVKDAKIGRTSCRARVCQDVEVT